MDKNKEELLMWLAERWRAPELLAQRPVLAWQEAGLPDVAQPLYVQAGVLYLAVPNHIVASEIYLRRREILSRLAEAVKEPVIRDIRVLVRSRAAGEPEVRVPPPTLEEVRACEARLGDVGSEALRRRLAETWAWIEARDRAIVAQGGHRCPACGVAYLGDDPLCPLCTLGGRRGS